MAGNDISSIGHFVITVIVLVSSGLSVLTASLAARAVDKNPVLFLNICPGLITLLLVICAITQMVIGHYIIGSLYIIGSAVTLLSLFGLAWKPKRWIVAITVFSLASIMFLVFAVMILLYEEIVSPVSSAGPTILSNIMFFTAHVISLVRMIRWYNSFSRHLAEQLCGIPEEEKAEIRSNRFRVAARSYPLSNYSIALWLKEDILRQKAYGLHLCCLLSQVTGMPYFCKVAVGASNYALSFSQYRRSSTLSVSTRRAFSALRRRVVVGVKEIMSAHETQYEVGTIQHLPLSQILRAASGPNGSRSFLSISSEDLFMKAICSSNFISIPSLLRLRLIRYWADTLYMQSRPYNIRVARDTAYNDFRYIFATNGRAALGKELWVSFKGEEAVDIGGLKRELFTLIGDRLFMQTPAGGHLSNVVFSEASNELIMSSNILPLDAFCMGWLIGRCLCYGISLSAQLSSLFLSLVVGVSPTLTDITLFEPGLGNLIASAEKDNHAFAILKESIPALARMRSWYRSFTVRIVLKGEQRCINLHRINLEKVAIAYFFPNAGKKLRHLRRGFRAAVPAPACYFVDVALLKAIVVGAPSLAVDDWRKHAVVDGFRDRSEVVDWFWELLAEDQDLAVKVLRFSCGVSAPPQEGFCNLGQPLFAGQQKTPFTLRPCPEGWLPMSHTCTNVLQIPVVGSKEDLRKALTLATKVTSMNIK